MTAKLYTKKGDSGKTSLFSGRRAEKSDPRIAAVGDLDELSASIGFTGVAYPPANDLLRSIQRALCVISAIVSAEQRAIDVKFDATEVEALEIEIDRVTAAFPELREFIFPGEARTELPPSFGASGCAPRQMKAELPFLPSPCRRMPFQLISTG
jgi:cob(I)alamin adenosyltransferase